MISLDKRHNTRQFLTNGGYTVDTFILKSSSLRDYDHHMILYNKILTFLAFSWLLLSAWVAEGAITETLDCESSSSLPLWNTIKKTLHKMYWRDRSNRKEYFSKRGKYKNLMDLVKDLRDGRSYKYRGRLQIRRRFTKEPDISYLACRTKKDSFRLYVLARLDEKLIPRSI